MNALQTYSEFYRSQVYGGSSTGANPALGQPVGAAADTASSFDLDSGRTHYGVLIVPAARTVNSTSPKLSNDVGHSEHLTMLYEAIGKLAVLPVGHDMHIDAGVRVRAEEFLSLVALQSSLPKIFPQDGDSLVFTWDMGPRKRMITITEEDAAGMDIDKRSRLRCDFDIVIDDPEARKSWLPNIADGILASSTTDIE